MTTVKLLTIPLRFISPFERADTNGTPSTNILLQLRTFPNRVNALLYNLEPRNRLSRTFCKRPARHLLVQRMKNSTRSSVCNSRPTQTSFTQMHTPAFPFPILASSSRDLVESA
ncbi:hypothetical protein CC2G_003778 [Coprinopsis cinerea AmutBmut pab1-1]|nr:hypothetical protein CC2G_003778 [Coprinopsis cinerea AmutBmut pab1-1]